MLPTPILIGAALIGLYVFLSPAAPWRSSQQTPGVPPAPTPPASPQASDNGDDSVPPFVSGFSADSSASASGPLYWDDQRYDPLSGRRYF